MSELNLAMSSFKCSSFIHQAKIRPTSDKNMLANSKISIYLKDFFGSTTTISESLSPVWNESIDFNGIMFFGDLNLLKNSLPFVMIELVDVNREKKTSTSLGSSFYQPYYSLEHETSKTNEPEKQMISLFVSSKQPQILKWIPLTKNGCIVAEVLLSIELIELSNDERKNCTNKVAINGLIPNEILPIMNLFYIEIIFIGIRNFEKLHCNTFGRYKIEITFGELKLQSGPSGKNLEKSFNFVDSFVSGYVKLPTNIKYWPPMIVKFIQCIIQDDIVGAASISSLDKCLVNNLSLLNVNTTNVDSEDLNENDSLQLDESVHLIHKSEKKSIKQRMRVFLCKKLNIFKSVNMNEMNFVNEPGTEETNSKKTKYDETYSWWTKFYNSINKDSLKHHLTVSSCSIIF